MRFLDSAGLPGSDYGAAAKSRVKRRAAGMARGTAGAGASYPVCTWRIGALALAGYSRHTMASLPGFLVA